MAPFSFIKSYHCDLSLVLGTADGNVTGFTVFRQGSQLVHGKICNSSTYETIIVWKCDGKKVWNPSSSDISASVISATRFGGDCLVSLSIVLLLSFLSPVPVLHTDSQFSDLLAGEGN